MPNLTIKNIPDELFEKLKAAAERHHRSMNKEAIACIDAAVSMNPARENAHMNRAREIASNFGKPRFTIDEIVETVRSGRDRRE